jgi:hypothetical protein
MSNFFDFELEFVDSLRCIPMLVRLKLDTCGVKLKLSHWNQFTNKEKEMLINKPCFTSKEVKDYHDFLQNLIVEKTGLPAKELPIEENPLWLNELSIPDDVMAKAGEFNLNLTLNQWQNLTPLQRFALIKLSRPSHENRNFYPALKEFKLVDSH